MADIIIEFQSTCPARGTTRTAEVTPAVFSDFNPRAPRGARLRDFILIRLKARISIHVPREGHDDNLWGVYQGGAISIHVPREGHDG